MDRVVNIRSLRRTAGIEARRIAQTPSTFENWPELLLAIARSKAGNGPERLTFRTRSGPTISLPNAAGARVPAYEVFADHCYDLEWFLGDLVDRPIRVLEIGAHVGTFACHLAHLHPKASIDSFEPSADTAEYLRANIVANGLSDRVRAHPEALAGESGWAVFEQEGAASGHNHLAMDGAAGDGGVRVPTLSLGDAIDRIGGPVDLVKMDCEGGEYDLVYRSSAEHWASVQRLVLEYHRVEGESWPELRARFADHGLHVVRDTPGSPGIGVAWLSRDPLPDAAPDRERSTLGTLTYQVRRVAQTPVAFANWRDLFGQMARERIGHTPTELTFRTRDGVEITTPNVPGARLPAYEQFAEDSYGTSVFLGSLVDHPIHALDVGAHVGTFACHLARTHPGATITCFEPSPNTASWLRQNLVANGLDQRVDVVEAALTGAAGTAEFVEQGVASVHSGLVHQTGSDVATIEVPTLGFDDVIADAPAPVRFVKLDCEGGEYELAYRSSPDSWSTVERVVLEYHEVEGQSWAELRAWFAGVGLHLVRLEAERRDLGRAWLSRGASPWSA